jgi:ATP-dependent RNA helicase RhlE
VDLTPSGDILSFDHLGLSEALLRSVAEKGYETPSPVQAKCIPAVLEDKDVLASAQTGTGKTAGFTLPILEKLSRHPIEKGKRPIRCLILTPTRELAAQVGQSVKDYGTHLQLRSTVVFGGVNINPQKAHLRGGVDILIATPGRLLDLQQQKIVDLSTIEIFVLDEADRMLDMGFIHDIKKVMKLLPARRQNLLFSATYNNDMKALATGILNNPVSIEVAPRNTTAEMVKQELYKVDKPLKTDLLKHLIKTHEWKQVLVFVRTKHGADRLCRKLDRSGIKALAIHGNKTQGARTKALEMFKENKIQAMVATDIAARGIDIKELPHVVNFELPNVPEDYVHRIGRTGRAGSEGHAVSLVDAEETKYLKGIQSLLGKRLNLIKTPQFEKSPAQPRGGPRNQNRPIQTLSRDTKSQQGRRPPKRRPQ